MDAPIRPERTMDGPCTSCEDFWQCAGCCYLCVDCLHTLFLVCPLRNGQCLLCAAIEALRFYLLPGRQGGEVFQAEWSMTENNDIRRGRHCVFALHVHLVFVTKYRRGVFTQEVLDDLHPVFASVCADFEAELVKFDGEDDHVLPAVAVERRFQYCASTSSNSERPANYRQEGYAVLALHPRPEGQGFAQKSLINQRTLQPVIGACFHCRSDDSGWQAITRGPGGSTVSGI